jgi:serine O-acetyltransferase
MKNYIKSDLYRYCGATGKLKFIKAFLVYPGFKVTFFYRLAKYYKTNNRGLFVLFRLLHRHYVYKFGIELAIDASIGHGFYIGHFGGITISPHAIIGDNCNISQGVTIGIGGREDNRGTPEIGDGVYIGPGAKLFGKIQIGNSVAIGANAVVNKSFADNAVVVGMPSKSVSQNGAAEFIVNPFIVVKHV